ncbi:MAG: hypothetical protein Tsb0016_00260 [Sphingomonadales bacterium]
MNLWPWRGDGPVYALIGGLAGLAICWLDDAGFGFWNLPHFDTSAAAGVFAAALFFMLADRQDRRLAVMAAALVMGGLIALMAYAMRARYAGEWASFGARHMAAPVITVFFWIGLPFFQAWNERRDWRFDYGRLADLAWSDVLRALLGLLFVGVVWAVLGLWMTLFSAIGIDFFKDLFTDKWVGFGISGAAAGIALALLARWTVAIERLHGLLHGLFAVLAVLVAALVLVFVPSLLFARLDALWGSTLTTGLMLSLILLSLLLVNSVIGARDDEMPANPRHVYRLSALVLIIALPVLALLASLSLGQRIGAYGLTPERFYGAVALVFAFLFGGGYLAALAWRRGAWPAAVRQVNLVLAPLVALVAFLLATPILSAEAWSVRNQVARLVNGKVAVADFDFDFLRFRAGTAGVAALDRLLNHKNHPNYDGLAQAVAAAKEKTSPYHPFAPMPVTDARASLGHWIETGQVAIWPDPQAVPQEMLDRPLAIMPPGGCQPADANLPPCFLLAMPAWGGGGKELLFVAFFDAGNNNKRAVLQVLTGEGAGPWPRRPGSVVDLSGDADALQAALARGDISLVPRPVQAVRVGDFMFEPAPGYVLKSTPGD